MWWHRHCHLLSGSFMILMDLLIRSIDLIDMISAGDANTGLQTHGAGEIRTK